MCYHSIKLICTFYIPSKDKENYKITYILNLWTSSVLQTQNKNKNLGAEEMQYVLNEIGEKVFIVILERFQECAGQKV